MAGFQACGCCETPVRQGCACMCDTPIENVLTEEDDPLADENQTSSLSTSFALIPLSDSEWQWVG